MATKLDDLLKANKTYTKDKELQEKEQEIDELYDRLKKLEEKTSEPQEQIPEAPPVSKQKGLAKLMPRYAQPKPKPLEDTKNDFTDEEKQEIFNKHTAGKRYSKRERKMLLNMEKDNLRSTQWIILVLALIGIGFIFLLYQTTSQTNSWLILVILMLGSFMFLPAGMILGWAILDPYVRCKLLRRMTKRNYGIVNFVGKGNKMVSKIKNFDDSLIWIKNKVWVITREHIYQLTKQGDDVVQGSTIEPDNIISLIETVPVLFVDLDSMQPLTLAREGRESINPEELGSMLKSWADNQMAKAIMLKKTFDIYFVIIIICAIASALIGYVNYTRADEIMKQLTEMKSQIQIILESVRQTTPPP